MARVLLLAGHAATAAVPQSASGAPSRGQTPGRRAPLPAGPTSGSVVEEVLPALGLLLHDVSVLPPRELGILEAPGADVVLVDARRDLPGGRNLCRLLRASGMDSSLMAVTTEAGLTAVTPEWGLDDVVLDTAGPAEVEARLRLAIGRQASPPRGRAGDSGGVGPPGPLDIRADSYTATLAGRSLDLTFKEFELLRHLAQHPGRVFTRAQLLQEVWGYDYYGGTRTVDVHVRRLRAKLGVEHEWLIGTIRNVGYRFEVARREPSGDQQDATEESRS